MHSTLPVAQPAAAEQPRRPVWIASATAPAPLTPLALLTAGYHPFAGDAGLYVAGIRHILHRNLYPLNAAFPAAFTRLSVFPWILAGIVRLSHLPISWILLAAHLTSLFLFLTACRQLAVRLFPSESARWISTLLAALCTGLPVAGTALVLMDPYVTARSFSTPLAILAVATALDRAWGRTALLLTAAVLLHPLMGALAAAFVVLQICISARRTRLALALCLAACAVSSLLFAAAHRTPISGAYRQAVLLPAHSFLFLGRWQWYEILGLALPLILFGFALRKLDRRSSQFTLCLTSVLLGATATLIAATCVPPAGPYPLVPFQVLRSFVLVYAAGLALMGGVLDAFRKRAPLSAALIMIAVFAGMFAAQSVTWVGCGLIEWPGVAPKNPWQQTFLWIRANTPPSAVFAFDPQLVYLPLEDEQGFRAIAERDHLADDKDAGVAAVLPSLADRWARQRNPEAVVDQMTDAERLTTLPPLGANWLLLPHGTATRLPCPYRNSVAQICRLTP